MIKEFNGNYVGFQSKKSIGDVFLYEDEKWVIIKILNTRINMTTLPIVETKLIAQKVNSNSTYNDFTEIKTVSDSFQIDGRERFDPQPKQLGEVIVLRDEETNEKALSIVTGVKSFKYDYTTLIVDYNIEQIIPWTKAEMDKYIHKDRLSNFKVIVGGKQSS